ncbi:hypothetical protein EYF80_024199 [Liparis tanakae]|uniref:Uncharacterized protein n=1 Tax=Liparis tanakae TaxID=230148 RepID=A0A4Z2HIV5_9TELE|nr:hypothetical protein EYF80_024199 [Liparis tanakae]
MRVNREVSPGFPESCERQQADEERRSALSAPHGCFDTDTQRESRCNPLLNVSAGPVCKQRRAEAWALTPGSHSSASRYGGEEERRRGGEEERRRGGEEQRRRGGEEETDTMTRDLEVGSLM